MNPVRPLPPFRLRTWTVHPELHRIVDGDTIHTLEPRIMDVLVLLATKPAAVFTRDEILDEVWGEVVVGEEVLTRAISELRRLLGDDTRTPIYIETIRKGGYRLVAEPGEVTEGDTPASAARGSVDIDRSGPGAAGTSQGGSAGTAAAGPAGSSPAEQASPSASELGGPSRNEQTGPDNRRNPIPPLVLWVLITGLMVVGIVAGVDWALRTWRDSVSPDTASLVPLAVTPLTSYPGNEETPALSPDGTLVAFTWDGPEADNRDIYVMRVGSAEPLRLTDDPGVDIFPVWSPDGSELTFIHGGEDGAGIFTIPITGGEPRKLITARGRLMGMSWSPDGSHMIYSEGLPPNHAPALFRYDPGTGESVRLPVDVSIGALDGKTTPDGGGIDGTESAGDSAEANAEANAEAKAEANAAADHRGDMGPTHSPDGRQIAFIRDLASGQQELFVVPTEGGPAKQISHGLLRVRGLDWTRDSRSLVCSAFLNGSYSLWRVDVGSGDASWIPIHGEWIYKPTLARETDLLAYQHYWFEKNIWRIERSSDPSHGLATDAVITSTRWDCEAQFSPNGERLAFVSARSGFLEIWTCDRNGEHPLRITTFDGSNVSTPRWSPDGRQIAFTASPEGYNDLYLVDARGGTHRRLTHGQVNASLSGWSADGQWLYFGSDRGGNWNLWKLDPRRPGWDDWVQVTTDGGITAHESRDGRALYYTKHDQPGLWRRSLGDVASSDTRSGLDGGTNTDSNPDNENPGGPGAETDAVRILEDLPHAGDWSNWATCDEGIVLVRREFEGPMILFYRFDTGELEPVTRVPNIATPSLAISPDGEEILYARIEKSVGDLRLVKNFR